MKVSTGGERCRLEGLYVRVSGSSGQESSLEAQENALRDTSTGEVVKVFRDRTSDLREDRPGLNGLLRAVADGGVTVVRVTHADRLARFGVGWLKHLLAVHGATLMEARGMGRTMNTRLSQQVRGQIADRMRHLAAEHGIAVVTAPARNTSRHCPHCLTPVRHRKAPDKPTVAGWKWAICPNQSCRWQGDRDNGAWRRIAARGLTHQTKTVTDNNSGQMVIRTVVDKLEASAVVTSTSRKDRSKSGPTRHKPTRPAPRRRRAPSPTRPHSQAGKRPEGHAPTDQMRLPRAAHRHQGATTISTPTTGHQPRGAALGAGFHLHAHASPPRWETIPDTQSSSGSLS